MFERLSERLDSVFRRLRGRGRLTPADVDEAMREIRVALLEADVNFKIVKNFIASVRERAVGTDVLESLSPGQQVATIVYEELVRMMGAKTARLETSPNPPTIYMLVGLQGSGKTTTAGKLALHLSKSGRRPLLAAADVRRPAAVDQLRIVAQTAKVGFIGPEPGEGALTIATRAVAHAKKNGFDVLIIDTAGRLHIDDELMTELSELKSRVNPRETLFVADAMMGQDAVTTAETFRDRIGIDGVILTKVEGDARGGAALSIRAVIDRPIKFVGTGEKLDALEPFHPDRFASRILNMGDIETLVERASQAMDEQKARELGQRLGTGKFTLEDFVDQLKQVRSMGPIDQLLNMMPGMGKLRQKIGEIDDGQFVQVEAIINSMTPAERRNPDIITGSRRRRIAVGSGTTVQDVNRLLKQFDGARKMLRQVRDMGKKGKGPRLFS